MFLHSVVCREAYTLIIVITNQECLIQLLLTSFLLQLSTVNEFRVWTDGPTEMCTHTMCQNKLSLQ